MIFEIIVGAVALGAMATAGVGKVIDVADSIKYNGVAETVKQEAKNVGEFVVDGMKETYRRTEKELERKQKELSK